MYCLSDQLSSSKIISFKFSRSISAELSQSGCCSMPESSGIISASSMGIKSLSVQCTSKFPLLITHPLLSGDLVWVRGFSLAKSELRGKIRVANPVCEWTPRVHHVTCHVTPGLCPLFHEQKGTTPQIQARRYRAVYELFNYFHRNYFLSRNFIFVTNNSNNSYDISDYTRL